MRFQGEQADNKERHFGAMNLVLQPQLQHHRPTLLEHPAAARSILNRRGQHLTCFCFTRFKEGNAKLSGPARHLRLHQQEGGTPQSSLPGSLHGGLTSGVL